MERELPAPAAHFQEDVRAEGWDCWRWSPGNGGVVKRNGSGPLPLYVYQLVEETLKCLNMRHGPLSEYLAEQARDTRPVLVREYDPDSLSWRESHPRRCRGDEEDAKNKRMVMEEGSAGL
jgi:hypothetical protein